MVGIAFVIIAIVLRHLFVTDDELTAGVNPAKFSVRMLWFFAFTGLGACLVIGYVASIVVPQAKKDTDGLTIYTLRAAK